MSLQFVLGSAGQDHRTPMVSALAQQVTDHPQDRDYYLVPNHIKFETEVDVLSALKARLAPDQGLFAQSQVQVFSFTRLAWFFMKNEPVYQLPRISKAGLNMLIYQIIQSHADELTIFRGEVDRPGFVSQLAAQLAELKVGQVTAVDLMTAVEQMDTVNADLQAKLHDLMIIYEAFEQQMLGKYVENTDLLNQLADFLANKVDLSQAHFYLEGFSQLSAQERRLVAVLIEHAASVTVALNLDRPYRNQKPDATNLFYQSGRLYFQLAQVAAAAQVRLEPDQFTQQPRVSAGLQALDAYWQASNSLMTTPTKPVKTPANIQIVQAANRYVEVAQVAIKIRQMVATGNYRYQDFLVVARHLEAYQTVIDPIFKSQEIPYFDDADVQMADHPFVELINALFDVDRRNYRYADVFRVLKSELLLPKNSEGQPIDLQTYRQALALTENLVLKNGYEGQHRWTQKKDWVYTRFASVADQVQTTQDERITRQINLIRHFVSNTLPPLFQRLKKAETYTDAAAILYQFLDHAGVADRLMTWRDQAIDEGDLMRAGQPEQTWSTFCQMLDECHDILGNMPFNQTTFQAILQSGFAGAKYSQIPSTLDQVSISESGLVQANNRKVTFLMGATADNMPDDQVPTTLLADNDRQDLSTQLQATDETHYLRDDAATQLAGEPYLNYLAFMSASEQLIFSYPVTSDDDNTLQVSPYVARIQQHFNLKPIIAAVAPQAEQTGIRSFVGTRRTTLRHLVQASHDSQERQQPLSPAWITVYRLLKDDPTYGDLTVKLLGSLNYRNVPKALKPEIVTDLYGTHISTSISKLEEYYANPYAYFLKYGLKLQERDVFELSPASTGEFFHATMDGLIRKIHDQHLDLAKMDQQQLHELATEVMANVLDTDVNPQFAILQSSHRMTYIQQQLEKTMQKMAETLWEQSKRTQLRPRKTEVQFGTKNERTGLSFDLDNGRQVTVRGRIDRLDGLQAAGKTYLGIVDYKSSDHEFSFQEAFYGQSMQMLTYLDAVQQNLSEYLEDEDAQVAELAGAVYLHLQNPILKPADLKSTDPMGALLKAERYQGLLLNDPDLLKNIDVLFSQEGYSVSSQLFKSIAQKKAGGFYSRSGVLVTQAELDLLLAHTETLIKRAANGILSGKTDLAPVREKSQNKTAMQYTPYKAIMQFDPLLPMNNYHDLAPLKRDEVFKLIQDEQAAATRKEDHHE